MLTLPSLCRGEFVQLAGAAFLTLACFWGAPAPKPRLRGSVPFTSSPRLRPPLIPAGRGLAPRRVRDHALDTHVLCRFDLAPRWFPPAPASLTRSQLTFGFACPHGSARGTCHLVRSCVPASDPHGGRPVPGSLSFPRWKMGPNTCFESGELCCKKLPAQRPARCENPGNTAAAPVVLGSSRDRRLLSD